jgi:hypothetical protein
VFITGPIRNGHAFVIPAIVSDFLSTDQQNRASARIEGISVVAPDPEILIQVVLR